MSSAAKPGMQASVFDTLAYQDELVRSGQFEYLGKMKLLIVEASEGAAVAGHEVQKLGVRFDWRNEPNPKGGYLENFIPIGQSLDRRMLLALAPIVLRHGSRKGAAGLPDIPDPSWKRPLPDPGDPNPVFADPPLVQQSIFQRGVVALRENPNILVAQPVHQIMFQPEINQQLLPTYWALECEFDPATRTDMAFLVDRHTGAAHFYGGKYQVIPVG